MKSALLKHYGKLILGIFLAGLTSVYGGDIGKFLKELAAEVPTVSAPTAPVPAAVDADAGK